MKKDIIHILLIIIGFTIGLSFCWIDFYLLKKYFPQNDDREKIEQLEKEIGLFILEYKTYRSDMGIQVYEVKLSLGEGKYSSFEDGYFPPENEGQEKLLSRFKAHLTRLKTAPAIRDK